MKLIDITKYFNIKLCLLCNQEILYDSFCEDCHNLIKPLLLVGNRCIYCNNYILRSIICGSCQQKKIYYKEVFSSINYFPPIDNIIYDWKYKKQFNFTCALFELMLKNIPKWMNKINFDYIIPMPMSLHKLMHREFNQGYELSLLLGKYYNIKLLANNHIIKVDKTPQSLLSRKERLNNIKNSFIIKKPIEAQNVLIVDDVLTTGSTINELSKSLSKIGKINIYVWVLAHKSRSLNKI